MYRTSSEGCALMKKSMIHPSASMAASRCLAAPMAAPYSRTDQDSMVPVKASVKPNFMWSPASYIPLERSSLASLPSSSAESPRHGTSFFTSLPASSIDRDMHA